MYICADGPIEMNLSTLESSAFPVFCMPYVDGGCYDGFG